MQHILLAGNAAAARVVFGYLALDPRYTVDACVVDDPYVDQALLTDVPSVGISQVQATIPPKDVRIIMAVGYDKVNSVRQNLFEKLKGLGYAMETYIHPKANVLTKHPIGEGSVLMAGAVLEPGARLGCDCFLWANVVVAHDAVIDDHCWLAAGAVVSGMAKVGCRSFVGVNATISNKVEIGADNIVGGSAFMSRSTKPNMVHLARSGEPFRCSAQEYATYFGV
ncbi:MAG: acetyltransferase [Desulfovibrio sp.]|nr:acetyltransferase [Desulfovibrio sp.]